MSVLTDVLAGQVVEAVRQAGALLTDPAAIQTVVPKSRTDFVTNVDLTVQNTLRGQLDKLTPAVQFLGEEGERAAIDPRRPFWILDPVDGTTNLIHHFRHSAVSLALVLDGSLTAGIVYDPYADELFFAEKGRGSFRNGSLIHVSANQTLQDSLISIGTAPYQHEYARKNFEAFREIFLRCQDIRRIGSAAIDLAYVACGRTDAFFEMNLKPWDFAAGILLVREAGGTATDYKGSPLPLDRPASMLATNGFLHRELMELLA